MKKSICTSLILMSYLCANDIPSSCMSCHGENFEKKALGQSKIVQNMTAEEIYKSLKGYKDSTYGGKMKDLMKTQIDKFSLKDLKNITEQIKPFDKEMKEKITEKEKPTIKINLEENTDLVIQNLPKGIVESEDNSVTLPIEKISGMNKNKIENKIIDLSFIQKCLACHGENFEKKALGQSKIVQNMTTEEIYKSLKGYKDDTYGGKMKGLMQTQVTSITIEQIKEFSKNFSKK